MDKIKGILRASLTRCVIADNWPVFESLEKHVDSLAKEVLKHKSEWLLTSDVYSIYYHLLFELIHDKVDPQEKFSGSLIHLINEEGIQTLVDSISDFFVSVPRNYSIYLPLPRISKKIGHSIPISDSIEITTYYSSDEVPGGYQQDFGLAPYKKEINSVYLKITTSGYCNNNLENRTIREALANFKVLIQLGLSKECFKIVEVQPRGLLGSIFPYKVPKTSIVSVDRSTEKERVISTELPVEISKILDRIDLNWEHKHASPFYKIGKFDVPLKSALNQPSLLIKSNEPEASRVKAAIVWCFDSKTNESATMSFLQTCIGLESILGDDESNGSLTKKLADRLAYLISPDIKKRSEIKSTFKDLYDVRSKLVHGVKAGLEHDQNWYKEWGQDMLMLSINKEMKHLNLK